MSGLLNNSLFLSTAAAAAGGYQIQRSLRFNSSDSAFCARTPAVAGNRRTWTWAGWVKRSALGVSQALFEANPTGGATYTLCWFDSSDKLQIVEDQGAGGVYYPITDAVYRDTSAWYHIVFTMNTTLATSTDRIKIYVNGVLQTLTGGFPPLNNDTYINATNAHRIGYRVGNSAALSAYLADVHFIDGQALTPSSFTEVSATTGQLIPLAYSGSFGTNGFWLKFSDNSAATAATLGKDYSPNGNNWTPNNLSVTAGAGNDSLVDTPTSYGTDTGVGGEVRGNYCTLNPIDVFGSATFSDGNLQVIPAAGALNAAFGTIPVKTGKWYWEITVSSDTSNGSMIGVTDYSVRASQRSWYSTSGTYGYLYFADGNKYTPGTPYTVSAYGSSFTTGAVIGVALDMDNGTATMYKNGVSQGNIATGLTGKLIGPVLGQGASVSGQPVYIANFGQRAFAYTAPSGFKALCDTNLGAPLTAKPNTLMDVKLYTGNGSTQTISGLGFSPDLVWIKDRVDGTRYHTLVDSVRSNGGSGSLLELYSNATDAEAQFANRVTSLTSDGFTLGADATTGVNKLNDAHVAWTWDAGTSTVTNTSGSITSQVRANASAGFSVVTYTGTGANATVGHGLGVAPSMIFVKQRSGTSTWRVYHASLANTQVLYLSATDAATTETTAWNSTTPTSSVVSLGTGNGVNGSSSTYVAYCFSSVVGYSSFGSYTGNGSTDGPFVYTGFRPRWLLVKASSAGEGYPSWRLFDTARDTYNVAGLELYPNLSSGESDSRSATPVDILSNGFKLRANATWNTSGVTYIYITFAENPFQYARAR